MKKTPLEGEWHFVSLKVDGSEVPAPPPASAKLLIHGDRFRMDSSDGAFEGLFTIDVESTPARIDIEFVEGPEAGNWSYGIFEIDGDSLILRTYEPAGARGKVSVSLAKGWRLAEEVNVLEDRTGRASLAFSPFQIHGWRLVRGGS